MVIAMLVIIQDNVKDKYERDPFLAPKMMCKLFCTMFKDVQCS